MRGLSRLFWYLVYFFQAETSALRKEAYDSAKLYYAKRPLRHRSNPYPRVVEYQQRRDDFQKYQRAYINIKCAQAAKEKLAVKYGE
jgi:hypothetical protein